MPYSEMFKRKMVQKLSGPDALSASALSKQVDVPQTTLSKWLRMAGIKPPYDFPNNTNDKTQMRCLVTHKRPNDWSPEEKFKTVLEAESLSDEQLGDLLRQRGLHETHLQQWRLQMMEALGKLPKPKKKTGTTEAKLIRKLEKELRRKDKALAETAALLVLKKKVQEIWGGEDDNTTGKNGK